MERGLCPCDGRTKWLAPLSVSVASGAGTGWLHGGGGGEKLAARESVTVAVRAERYGVAPGVRVLPAPPGHPYLRFWEPDAPRSGASATPGAGRHAFVSFALVGHPADIGLSVSRETCRNIIGSRRWATLSACRLSVRCLWTGPPCSLPSAVHGEAESGWPARWAHGQCAVTALVIQDCLGGDLLGAEVSGISLLVVPGRGIRSDASSSVTSSGGNSYGFSLVRGEKGHKALGE